MNFIRLFLSLVGVAVLTVWAAAAPCETASTLVSTRAMARQSEGEAQRILARARQWAGGEAFEAVQSLTVRGTRGPRGQMQRMYDVSILRPDRCQIRQEGGWVHTLEGPAFWMTIPPGFQGTFGPDMQATADQGTRRNCTEILTTFLLRPPEGLGITLAAVGSIPLAGLQGKGVRVVLPGAEVRTFVFARDGRPLGYMTGSSGDAERVVIFREHATVTGSRFPSHIETLFLPSRNIGDWKIGEFRVNELKPEDFRRDGRSRADIRTGGGGGAKRSVPLLTR